MRFAVLLTVFFLQESAFYTIPAAEPAKQPAPDWQAAFTVLSADNQANKLVLMLVTNDDAFHGPTMAKTDRKVAAAQPADQATYGWCALDFYQSCQRMLKLRPDLKDKISFQSIIAGTPSELSGGKASDSPKRVVLFVCDNTYHLLALSIGIPNADELLTIIEDAQEVKTLGELNDIAPDQTTNALIERNKKRVGRLWNLKFDQLIKAKKQDDVFMWESQRFTEACCTFCL